MASGRPSQHSVGMGEPTHAALATFRLDLSRGEEQRQRLEQFILPGVRHAPGFISGCWTLDRSTAESVVLVTFESNGAAESFAGGVRDNAADQAAAGLELQSVRVVEVVATA